MKLFCKCFRENLSSPLLYAAAVLFTVLCGFGVTVVIKEETYSFFEIIFNSELFAIAKENIQCSSYIMAYNFSMSTWYIIGLSVIAAVPPLFIYINSIEKIRTFALIRSNYKVYSAGIILSSFFSGMIITLAGILLYIAAAYLVLPSFESFSDPNYMRIYGAAVSDRLFPLLKKIFNHAFVGGIISVFSIVLYRFIQSDFPAATIPMMLMYISVKIHPVYIEWFSSDEMRAQNTFLNVMAMSFPSSLTDLGRSLELSLKAPFWLAYIILSALLFGMYLLFCKSIRKV